MSKVREIDGDHEQFWRMAIETWQASGLSVRQFCTNEGLSEPSFYAWRKKLTGGSVQDEKDKPEPSAFIEVAIPRSNSVAVINTVLVLTVQTRQRLNLTLGIPHGNMFGMYLSLLPAIQATGF